ncbi:MAG: hypothetical protein M9953_07405 [Thermomicrobiales bacterium]|nr:hypothetical protein [Thermomicrobiales bacterium]
MTTISHVGAMKPVRSYADLQATIRESLAPWNNAIARESPANVSLRLSQAALNDPLCTAENLRSLLGEYDLRLAGISGVSIGGGAKTEVHRPDWRSEERLSFMFPAANLATELAQTENFGITTNAFTYRSWIDPGMPGNWAALTLNLIRIVEHLVRVRDRTGLTIHIDIEAEPGSLLRDTDDIVRYWQEWLIPRGAAMLSDRMPITDGTAVEAVLRHVRIALDTAHAAVVWDDPVTSLDRLVNAGVQIGRLQVSAALECEIPAEPGERMALAEMLREQQSPTLLQQVVAIRDDEIVVRHDDLPEAIAVIDESVGEIWRIHTHAPLLADRYGMFRSTRPLTATWLQEIATRDLNVDLIELRSANWSVVPADDRGDIAEMIAREAEWVREVL